MRLAVSDAEGEPLSAREVDRLSGLTLGHTSQIERHLGDKCTGQVLAALSATFGVSIDYLVLGAGQTPTKAALRDALAQARRRYAQRAA